MGISLEETQIDLAEAPPVVIARNWWETPLLVLILGTAAILMLAWLAFLGWAASWILFTLWP